jgi:2-keto-3-deoxy-L-rhamnonate aldolase RhmA
MIETARGVAQLDAICGVTGLTGVYVGPADLAICLGCAVTEAWTHPTVREALTRIQATVTAAGLVAGIHAGNGGRGKAAAQMGYRMISLASESQALRRGASAHLKEASATDAH